MSKGVNQEYYSFDEVFFTSEVSWHWTHIQVIEVFDIPLWIGVLMYRSGALNPYTPHKNSHGTWHVHPFDKESYDSKPSFLNYTHLKTKNDIGKSSVFQ